MATPSVSELSLSYSTDEPVTNVGMSDDTFTITSAVAGNTGQYSCLAENDVASRELIFYLTVQSMAY